MRYGRLRRSINLRYNVVVHSMRLSDNYQDGHTHVNTKKNTFDVSIRSTRPVTAGVGGKVPNSLLHIGELVHYDVPPEVHGPSGVATHAARRQPKPRVTRVPSEATAHHRSGKTP